jgi:hypothetical protein
MQTEEHNNGQRSPPSVPKTGPYVQELSKLYWDARHLMEYIHDLPLDNNISPCHPVLGVLCGTCDPWKWRHYIPSHHHQESHNWHITTSPHHILPQTTTILTGLKASWYRSLSYLTFLANLYIEVNGFQTFKCISRSVSLGYFLFVCYCLRMLWLAKVIQHQWQWMIGWWWSTGGMILTGINQSSVREIHPCATLSTRYYIGTALNQTQTSVAIVQQVTACTMAWAPVVLFAGK